VPIGNLEPIASEQEVDDAIAVHATTPHGGPHPDLTTHDTMGLATQAELDAHATGPHGGGAHAASHNDGGADALAEDQPAATASLRSLGTGASQAAAGNHGHDHGSLSGLADDDHSQYALDTQVGVANGIASLNASTRVPDAQLGSGTADATTFLRGDRAWATPGGVPAGVIVMWAGLLSAIPSGWALCDGTLGTPDLRSRFVKGTAAGVDPGATGGAATHTHAAHAAHVVTQPSAHAAHVVTQPSAHTVTQPSDHASHTHTYTQTVNHVHRQQYNPTTTGALSGPTTAPDTSSSGTAAWGTVDTQNPTGGVATGTTAGPGATITHTGTAVSAHAGTAVDAHSAHTGTAVDAHSAHDAPNSEPAYFAIAYIQKL
jgi:hypothetical protein